MYGRRRGLSSGQLALMDAVVFFVTAMTISCVLLYYARAEVVLSPSTRLGGQADPEVMLDVFLHASIGEEIVLGANGETHVSSNSEIAECLQIELDALVLGENLVNFAPMNERLLLVLESICNQQLDPFLTATKLSNEECPAILHIPNPPPDSATLYASSVELSCNDGSAFLLTLVLAPTSLPKILHIGVGNLDSGLCIVQASAQL